MSEVALGLFILLLVWLGAKPCDMGEKETERSESNSLFDASYNILSLHGCTHADKDEQLLHILASTGPAVET